MRYASNALVTLLIDFTFPPVLTLRLLLENNGKKAKEIRLAANVFLR
jgi:hypothetical protein